MKVRDRKKPYVEKGSYSEYAATHEEIGYGFGISRATAGVIEKQAMANFKKELEKRGISLNDLLWR